MNVNLLKKTALFSSLAPADLAELATYLQRQSCKSNHTVFWMEEKGDHLYIIESGKVRISYTDEDGRENTLTTLGPGSFFGELSLIDGGTHTATARTLTDCVLLTLDQPSFYHFLDKHPELSHALLHTLTTRLRSSTIMLRGVVNINDQLEAKSSPFQQFIDRLAKTLTSVVFLASCIFFILAWMAVQIYYFERVRHTAISFYDRPPTFFLLGFMITLTSFLLTILILNSQRRQAENDRIRGEIEYQVNLKSQTEVLKLQHKMDRLIESVRKLSGEEPKDDSDPTLF